MKICLECGSIFNRFSELKEGIICQTLFCSGEVVEIDDDIVSTILLLNKKGYGTTHCCSGHTWGNDPFIVFDTTVHPLGFSTLPKDFSSSVIFNGSFRVSRLIHKDNAVKRQKELMKASVDLITWADKLQFAQNMEVSFYINSLINEVEFIQEVGKLLFLDHVQTDDADKDDKWLVFEKVIDPLLFEKLTKNFEAFAEKKGIEVSTAIYE